MNKRQVQEDYWLYMNLRGTATSDLARQAKVSIRRIQVGIACAKVRRGPTSERPYYSSEFIREPDLEPLFGCLPHVPGGLCPHVGPIADGEPFICMQCHRSGAEDHPALQRDPKTDPLPEPKPEPVPEARRQTRRERRAQKFGPPRSNGPRR